METTFLSDRNSSREARSKKRDPRQHKLKHGFLEMHPREGTLPSVCSSHNWIKKRVTISLGLQWELSQSQFRHATKESLKFTHSQHRERCDPVGSQPEPMHWVLLGNYIICVRSTVTHCREDDCLRHGSKAIRFRIAFKYYLKLKHLSKCLPFESCFLARPWFQGG